MINTAGVLQRITNDGGTDVNPSGIVSLSTALDGLYPSLALACSAGKVSALFAHYSFKYGEAYRARVVADSGTVAFPNYVAILASFRNLDLLGSASLIVPCDAGKASVLYAIENLGLTDSTLDEASTTAFSVTTEFPAPDAPELVITNVTATQVVIDVLNPKPGFDIRLYEAEVSAGGFATYAFKQNITNASLPVTLTYSSTTDINRKLKATFRHAGDTTTVSPQSDIRVVVGYVL